MRIHRLVLPLAASALVIAAGCGAQESPEPVATRQVTMVKSYRFDPGAIVIDAGDSVTWTNDDNFTHTVQVDGQDHDVAPGGSVSITFDEPGTYHYVCTLHRRDMEGEVIVQ